LSDRSPLVCEVYDTDRHNPTLHSLQ